MNRKAALGNGLSDKELLIFIRDMCSELAATAMERGMNTVVPGLQSTALASENILTKMAEHAVAAANPPSSFG